MFLSSLKDDLMETSLKEWSIFLEQLTGILSLGERTGSISVPTYSAETYGHGGLSPLIEKYIHFLQTSRIISLIPPSSAPILFQKAWPTDLSIIPSLINGSIVLCLRGNQHSAITCKFFRLKHPNIPKVEFMIHGGKVDCILKSDIAWPCTSSLVSSDPSISASGFPNCNLFSDSRGRDWLFPVDKGRENRKLDPRVDISRVIDQPPFREADIYPPEYQVPELDQKDISLDEIKEILRELNYYDHEHAFAILDMAICLLAMKISISNVDNIPRIFANNLHNFGYIRTPLDVLIRYDITWMWNDIMEFPQVLYKYQSIRTQFEPYVSKPLETESSKLWKDIINTYGVVGKRPFLTVMSIPTSLTGVRIIRYGKEELISLSFESSPPISVPLRSTELMYQLHKDRLTRQFNISRAKEMSEQKGISFDSPEGKILLAESFKRPIPSDALLNIVEQAVEASQYYESPTRWEMTIEWPPFVESKEIISINGVELSIADIKYVFHDTPLEAFIEYSNGNITTETFPKEQLTLIKSFLDGKIAPETFYRKLTDSVFMQLNVRFGYLDRYEKPSNREMANLHFIIDRRFAELLQEIEAKFFKGVTEVEGL